MNELRYYRENIIKNVIYPCSTVLDDSIGSALWFAARGNGITNQPYQSLAEVKGQNYSLSFHSYDRTGFIIRFGCR